jgi:hypothetical protein
MSHAIIDWDLMRLPTTRHTPLTGDAKTVAVLNVMQIVSFQMMNRCYSDSDMLVQGFPTVAILRQEVRVVPTTVPHLSVPLHCTIPGALHLPSPTLPLHFKKNPTGFVDVFFFFLLLFLSRTVRAYD